MHAPLSTCNTPARPALAVARRIADRSVRRDAAGVGQVLLEVRPCQIQGARPDVPEIDLGLSAEGFCVIDAEDRLRFLNASAARMFGLAGLP